jgi:IS5 family transposase
MLAGLLLGLVHDRKLMREAQVNLAIRRFAGFGLHESLPHHSTLTKVRQRGVNTGRGVACGFHPDSRQCQHGRLSC